MAGHLEDRSIGSAPLTVPSPEARFRLEPSPRRVRVLFGGETIADSVHVLLLRERRHLPVFYFPLKDVRSGALERTVHATESDLKGAATYWTVRAGDRVAENAAWIYDSPLPDGPDLKGYVAFYWSEMDAWYEEEEACLSLGPLLSRILSVGQVSPLPKVVFLLNGCPLLLMECDLLRTRLSSSNYPK
jgi:uncharacterized protein (DUF427 family)